MIPNTTKIIILYAASYVGLGMIVFPQWWAMNLFLRKDDFFWIIQDYLFLNLAASAVLVLTLLWHHYLEANKSIFVSKINSFLNSKYYLSILTFLVIFSFGRLSIEMNRFTFSSLKSEIEISKTDEQSPFFDKVVDFVFIDEKRIVNAYDQIENELQLQQKVIDNKDKSAVSLEGGSKDLLTAKTEESNEVGSQETYVATHKTLPRKAKQLIEFLHSNQILKTISSIELQNEDLKAFDEALYIVEHKNKITIDQIEKLKTRQNLINKSLVTDIPTFIDNSWVLLKGKMIVSDSMGVTTISFDYVPSIPLRVIFSSHILDFKELDDVNSQSRQQWSLNVFGKIINQSRTKSGDLYIVQAYAIFR